MLQFCVMFRNNIQRFVIILFFWNVLFLVNLIQLFFTHDGFWPKFDITSLTTLILWLTFNCTKFTHPFRLIQIRWIIFILLILLECGILTVSTVIDERTNRAPHGICLLPSHVSLVYPRIRIIVFIDPVQPRWLVDFRIVTARQDLVGVGVVNGIDDLVLLFGVLLQWLAALYLVRVRVICAGFVDAQRGVYWARFVDVLVGCHVAVVAHEWYFATSWTVY